MLCYKAVTLCIKAVLLYSKAVLTWIKAVTRHNCLDIFYIRPVTRRVWAAPLRLSVGFPQKTRTFGKAERNMRPAKPARKPFAAHRLCLCACTGMRRVCRKQRAARRGQQMSGVRFVPSAALISASVKPYSRYTTSVTIWSSTAASPAAPVA